MVLIKMFVQRRNLGKEHFFNHSSQDTVCFPLPLQSQRDFKMREKMTTIYKMQQIEPQVSNQGNGHFSKRKCSVQIKKNAVKVFHQSLQTLIGARFIVHTAKASP